MESGKEVRETTRSRSGPVRIGSRRRVVNAAVSHSLVQRVCHSHRGWTKSRGPHNPTTDYPEGYLRYYNNEGAGQPLDALGKPGLQSATRLEFGGGSIPGYYSWLEQFLR